MYTLLPCLGWMISHLDTIYLDDSLSVPSSPGLTDKLKIDAQLGLKGLNYCEVATHKALAMYYVIVYNCKVLRKWGEIRL
jgi:hypothetical protein